MVLERSGNPLPLDQVRDIRRCNTMLLELRRRSDETGVELGL